MQLLRSIFHYRNFFTTTSCSAPVLCIGTLILVDLATWISPLPSYRLVPVVPQKSQNQDHATYTPSTTYTVSSLLVDLSWVTLKSPFLMLLGAYRCFFQWFTFVRLPDLHLTISYRLFLNAYDHRSLQQPLKVVWSLFLAIDFDGPTIISSIASQLILFPAH